jgi:DNA-binding NarL/FixJ family response regulator
LRIAARFLRTHADVRVVGAVQRSAEALEGVQALRPDIVLIDLAVPGPSGRSLISYVREAAIRTHIIALSLDDEAAYRQAALAAGADAFVAKAVLHTDLVPAIRRLAGGHAGKRASGASTRGPPTGRPRGRTRYDTVRLGPFWGAEAERLGVDDGGT